MSRARISIGTSLRFANEQQIGLRLLGELAFIFMFVGLMVGINLCKQKLCQPFDPCQFIRLNLVLPCLAALQPPIIMMSQNRQAVTVRGCRSAGLSREVESRIGYPFTSRENWKS